MTMSPRQVREAAADRSDRSMTADRRREKAELQSAFRGGEHVTCNRALAGVRSGFRCDRYGGRPSCAARNRDMGADGYAGWLKNVDDGSGVLQRRPAPDLPRGGAGTG